MSNKTEQVKKGIILADLQFPKHNRKLLELWEQYLASEKWDYIIYLGDFADMDAISHHAIERSELRMLEGKRLKEDYTDMSAILRRHRKIVGNDCKIYFFLGNHEEWAEKFVDKYPMLEGMIEIQHNLPFKELNIDVIGYRKHLKIGKIYFIHGDLNRSFAPANHARKVIDIYGKNVVYGHHHTLQVAAKLSPAGIDETHTAHCIPALCDINPDWAGGRPNQWLNGFGVFYVTPTAFSVLPIVSAKNKFVSPEGRMYK